MKNSSLAGHLLFSTVVILLVTALWTPLLGGPGGTDDPVVSLSYLEMATKLGEMQLKKNDEIPVKPGTIFVLVEGKSEMRGVGDYILIDLTIGKSFKRGKEITDSHLYTVAGGSDLKIIAKDKLRILLQGGETRINRSGK